MKKKSDYAIIISCNQGYSFGMMATMNAMAHFKTDADWEVAYSKDDKYYNAEFRQKISNAFPFRVNWTPIEDLMEVVVDKRTDPKRGGLNIYWLAYWLLAHKVLKEKKYKAVCVIQADTFVFVNLDVYFKIAEQGVLVMSEHAFGQKTARDLPFGNTQAIWDRSQCEVTDTVNFIGQQYTQLPIDTVHFQEEDPFKGESNHSVIALNRATCRHGTKDKMLPLDKRLWVCDCIWPFIKLHISGEGDRVFNDRNIQLRAWHCRWWQEGRSKGEWRNNKANIIKFYKENNEQQIEYFVNKEDNYNLVKSFMVRFNDMRPEVKSELYMKGKIRRPRYENGEE